MTELTVVKKYTMNLIDEKVFLFSLVKGETNVKVLLRRG